MSVTFAVGLFALRMLAAPVFERLTFNITSSIPRGLYWIDPMLPGQVPSRGELVLFPIPGAVRGLLDQRGYVPPGVEELAKPVAAVGGDVVCIEEGRVTINGYPMGEVLRMDSEGRVLPEYLMCCALGEGEVFVASWATRSFDSRNFGPVRVMDVRGTLEPLITFQ